MTNDKTLMIVAVVAVIVSLVGVVFSLVVSTQFDSWLVGLSPGLTPNQTLATVNVTIVSNLAIKFTNDTVNWGSGSVNTAGGFISANLTSEGVFTGWLNTTPANVTNGFVLENIGTINATLYIKSEKNATGFLMGSSLPSFENFTYKVRGCSSVSGFCSAYAGGVVDTTDDTSVACGGTTIPLGVYRDVNSSTPVSGSYLGDRICTQYGWEPTKDELRIDVSVVIPSTASTGAKGTIMTATAECPPGGC